MMKKSMFVLMSTLLASQMAFANPTPAAEKKAEPVYQLTSHVLDINAGVPAAGVKIELKKLQANGSWKLLATKRTNENGRIRDFLPKTVGNANANDGTYKLVFYTADYYGKRKVSTFYPYVEVVFNLKGDSHYHVPITLSPFGYSTYRGS